MPEISLADNAAVVAVAAFCSAKTHRMGVLPADVFCALAWARALPVTRPRRFERAT